MSSDPAALTFKAEDCRVLYGHVCEITPANRENGEWQPKKSKPNGQYKSLYN